MKNLTALDIKQQEFEKSFRGYDVSEVKAYLTLVANEWEYMVSRQKELEKELSELRKKMEHYERMQEGFHETLQIAKESAEQKISKARTDAQNKVEKAEMEAEKIISEARQQRQDIKQSIYRLLERRKEIIGNMKSYLDMAQDSLRQFDEDETNIFVRPKGESEEELSNIEKKIKLRKSSSATEAEGEGSIEPDGVSGPKKETTEENSTMLPGTEDLDDLIDELD